MPYSAAGLVPVVSIAKIDDIFVQIMEYESTDDLSYEEDEKCLKNTVIIDLLEHGTTERISDSGIGNSRFVSVASADDFDQMISSCVNHPGEICRSLQHEFLQFLQLKVPTESGTKPGLSTAHTSSEEFWPSVSEFEQWILSKLPNLSMPEVMNEGRSQFVSDLLLFASRSGPGSMTLALRELGLLQPGEQLANNFTAFQTAAIWQNKDALREFGVEDPDKVAAQFLGTMNADELYMVNQLEGVVATSGDLCHDLGPYYIGKSFSLQVFAVFLHIKRNSQETVGLFWDTQLLHAIENGNLVLCDVMVCVFGANVDHITAKTLWRPLHYAASYGYLSLVKLLLSRGANPNAVTCTNELPEDLCPRCVRAQVKEALGGYREIRLESLKEQLNRNTVPQDLSASDLTMQVLKRESLLFWAAANCSTHVLETILKVPEVPFNSQNPLSGNSLLMDMVLLEDLEKITLLFSCNVCPRLRNFFGYSALDLAVENGRTGVVSHLLQFPQCWTGFQNASRMSKSTGVSLLLEKAAKRRQQEIVKPAIFLAAAGELSQLGNLELGDDLKVVNLRGESPVQVAARNGQVQAIEVIAEYGGDLWTRHKVTLDTALHAAAKSGSSSVMNLLAKLASKRKHVLDLNALNAACKTAAHLAAENGHADALRTLFQLGASCTGYFKDGLLLRSATESVQAVLDEFRLSRQMAIFRSIEKGDLKTLKANWKSKFDHYFRNHIGDTPLMVAAQTDNVKIVGFLLESCEQEYRPLGPEVEIEHDADVEALIRNSHHKSPGHIEANTAYRSLFSGNKKLTFHQWIFGNSENSPSDCVPTIFVSEYAVNHISAINIVDGCCALHRCVEVGDNVDVAKRLVNKDPFCVNIQEHNGFTSLHLAVILRRRNIIKYLIGLANIDLYATDLFGRMPEEFAENVSTLRQIRSARTGMPNSWAVMCDEEIPLSTADGLSNWTRKFESVASGMVQMGSAADCSRFAGATSASQDGVFEYMDRKLAVLAESNGGDEEDLAFRPSITTFEYMVGAGIY